MRNVVEWTLRKVMPDAPGFAALLSAAERLEQAKYVLAPLEYVQENCFVGAFQGDVCIGFLRFVILEIGRDAGRPPIIVDGESLREGFVEAFGVVPEFRRRGIGRQLQEAALAFCRARGCYQMRSRSPITSVENYRLKVKMGYAIHPSNENDSYYFIKVF